MAGSSPVFAGVAGASGFAWTEAAEVAAVDWPEFSADDWTLATAEKSRIAGHNGSTNSRIVARPVRNARKAFMGSVTRD